VSALDRSACWRVDRGLATPSNYSGLAANIILHAPVSVTGAVGTPITITTGTAHGLTTGDTVEVLEVRGNAAANGIWVATVTGGSTFTIPPATSGAYSGSGLVQSLAVGVPAAIPSPGDPGSAASVDTMLKRLSDQTAFLGRGTGGYKLAKRNVFYRINSLYGNSSWAAFTVGSAVAGTPAQLTTQAGLTWFTSGPGTLGTPTAGQGPDFFMDGIYVGDQIVVDMASTVNLDTTAMVVLYWALTPEATGAVWPTDYDAMTGAASYQVGGATIGNLSMRGFADVPATGNLRIQPAVFALTSSTQNYTLYGDVYMSVEVWRPTTMPQ
jgi:hypothetical protein